MNTRTKRSIRILLSFLLVLGMAFQSFAAPVSYAGPAAASEPEKVTGTWSRDAAGNWNFNARDGAAKDGWYYLNTGNHSGEYNWFCFDADGVMRTGWIQDKTDPSVWYYAGESKDSSEGGMVKGWITDPQDGKRYYLDPATGIMCYGWKQISGLWYYFGESRYADRRWGLNSAGYWTAGKSGKHSYGSLYMNEYTPDGYYVGSNGPWIPNHSENDSDEPAVVSVTGVSLDKSEVTFGVGDTCTLNAAVAPANATNKNVTWSSSESTVATVDAAGKVTAVAAGTAIITVITVDGGKTATCTITVKASAPETYTVTFDMQGHGAEVEPLTDVTYGSKISAPAAPTAEGYTFGGWYREAGCTNAWNFDNDTVIADITLFAKWTVELTPVDAPTAATGLTYNGTEQTGVTEAAGYTVTNGKAIGAGAYTATAMLANGYKWSDGTTDAKQIEWFITKAALTAKADDKEVTVGDEAPDYTVTYTGWVNGESIDTVTPDPPAELACEYTKSSEPGQYDITFATEPVFENYSVTTEKGTLTAESSCIAAGTMISMPEGRQKAVEELEIGDVVCTFDHDTGEVSSAPVVFIWESKNAGNAFTLTFEGGIEVTVIEEHGFYDQDEQKYAFINLRNAKDYIGHHFYHADTNNWLELESCEALSDRVDAYAIITSGDLNHMSNGMLSMCDGTVKVLANLFAYDDQMRFDAEKKKADIETWGLTSKEKILELEGFIEADYDDYNLQYLNIAIGKDLITWEWMEALSDYCVANEVVNGDGSR